MVESETGRLKRNSVKLLIFLWDFVHALRLFLCTGSYILNFSGVKEPQMKKMSITFLVCQDYNNRVVREGRTCASTKTCPGLSIIFSHVANVYWVLGTKSGTLRRGCEPVLWQVLTRCFHFEHPEIANKNVWNSTTSVLAFFRVEGSPWSKIPFHIMKWASFITLMPSLHQFPFTIRLYDDAN